MHGDLGGVSVVIPTFDRAALLLATVHSVFESDVDGLGALEMIVVDDGSVPPAGDVLTGVATPAPWTVRVARQDNAGVGAARNAGYRAATGSIVVFVDDDMLLLPGTLRAHVEAHRGRPGVVVFGRSPYVDQPRDRFVDWVLALDNDPHGRAGEALVRVPVVASGHLSIERTGFVAGWRDLYADDMRIPVAEEYELSGRLSRHGVPVFVGRDIVALHNRAIGVDAFLDQQYGHGRGCAAAARRHPDCLALDQLRTVLTHHHRRTLTSMVWRLLGTGPARSVLRHGAHLARRRRCGPLAPVIFTAASGAWFSAGLRAA